MLMHHDAPDQLEKYVSLINEGRTAGGLTLFSQIYSRSVSATATQLGFGLPVNEASAVAQASANPVHWDSNGCRICSAVALAGAGSIKQSSPVQILGLTSSVPVAVSRTILTTRGHAHPSEPRSHKTSRNRTVGVLRYCLAGMEEDVAPRYAAPVLGLETTKGKGLRNGRR